MLRYCTIIARFCHCVHLLLDNLRTSMGLLCVIWIYNPGRMSKLLSNKHLCVTIYIWFVDWSEKPSWPRPLLSGKLVGLVSLARVLVIVWVRGAVCSVCSVIVRDSVQSVTVSNFSERQFSSGAGKVVIGSERAVWMCGGGCGAG